MTTNLRHYIIRLVIKEVYRCQMLEKSMLLPRLQKY
nr:MAG TPA: hypothetical protein [Caudoviricetes sp.]